MMKFIVKTLLPHKNSKLNYLPASVYSPGPGDGCRLQAVAVVAKYFPIKSLKEPIFHPSSELQSC